MSAALRCELFVADLWVAVGFYVEVLAFTVVRDERESATPYAALERGSARLGLVQWPDAADRGQRRPPVGVELVLEVQDVGIERDRVLSAGWPLLEDLTVRPWGLTDFRLVDSEGYYWRVTDDGSGPR